MVLDDFYEGLRAVGFSSVTGDGLEELLKEIGSARKEYYEDFLPELTRKRKVAEKRREKQAKKDLERLRDDLVSSFHRKKKTVSRKSLFDSFCYFVVFRRHQVRASAVERARATLAPVESGQVKSWIIRVAVSKAATTTSRTEYQPENSWKKKAFRDLLMHSVQKRLNSSLYNILNCPCTETYHVNF